MSQPNSDSAILSAIMDAAVDAVIVSDDQGVILRANPAAHRLFGFDEGQLVGRNVSELMPESMSAKHDRFMSDYIETGVKKIIGIGRDVEGKRKDGETFPLHLSVGKAVIRDVPVFVAILHDLTRRIASEAALARSQRLDAIGQMTGGISHDFNNLLTVMIGNLKLLEMQSSNEKQRALTREALSAAEMASELTSRLMIFARKGHLHPVETDLREVCLSTLKLLSRTLGSRHQVETDFAEAVSLALVDPVQLESALVNLALNARDAMPEGGNLLFSVADISIDDDYMAQETDVAPGDYVRLMISDDGEGMTPEAQRMAFEPFFTTKNETHGTGLGLAMVYGFVRQSGGHITLYSEIGYGTSFGLYFPAISKPSTKAGSRRASGPRNTAKSGNGQTVLVVEDNDKVRNISVERLHSLGFKTTVAASGDEAYQMLKDGAEVDLVFTDVVMPGTLNGYDLAVKVSEEFPDVKILLTSGYASDVVTGKMAHGVNRVILHKPYHQDDLMRRLQALLGDDSD